MPVKVSKATGKASRKANPKTNGDSKTKAGSKVNGNVDDKAAEKAGAKIPTAGTGSDTKVMNDKDMKFIKAILGNMSDRPEVDWEMAASDYGDVKNKKQAQEKYRVMSIKYGWGVAVAAVGSPAKVIEPTEADLKFIKAMFDNMTSKPETDVSLSLSSTPPTLWSSFFCLICRSYHPFSTHAWQL